MKILWLISANRYLKKILFVTWISNEMLRVWFIVSWIVSWEKPVMNSNEVWTHKWLAVHEPHYSVECVIRILTLGNGRTPLILTDREKLVKFTNPEEIVIGNCFWPWVKRGFGFLSSALPSTQAENWIQKVSQLSLAAWVTTACCHC